jgi:hypothetical protein
MFYLACFGDQLVTGRLLEITLRPRESVGERRHGNYRNRHS